MGASSTLTRGAEARPLTLLTASTSNGSGSWIPAKNYRSIMLNVISTSETKDSGDNVVQLDSRTIGTDGNVVIQIADAAVRFIRATVSNRTDGAFTITGHGA
jgi:hypothetical protein